MLIIRPEQMAVLGRRFLVDRLVGFMRTHEAGATAAMSYQELRNHIERALDAARQLGLTWELTLARYVRLTLTENDTFFRQPAVSAALDRVRESDTPDLDFSRLESLVGLDAWESARAASRQSPVCNEGAIDHVPV